MDLIAYEFLAVKKMTPESPPLWYAPKERWRGQPEERKAVDNFRSMMAEGSKGSNMSDGPACTDWFFRLVPHSFGGGTWGEGAGPVVLLQLLQNGGGDGLRSRSGLGFFLGSGGESGWDPPAEGQGHPPKSTEVQPEPPTPLPSPPWGGATLKPEPATQRPTQGAEMLSWLWCAWVL